jgi:hypothetical protein
MAVHRPFQAIAPAPEKPSRPDLQNRASTSWLQMPWTERGAHLLLKVHTQVLNETWRTKLSRGNPGMEVTPETKTA